MVPISGPEDAHCTPATLLTLSSVGGLITHPLSDFWWKDCRGFGGESGDPLFTFQVALHGPLQSSPAGEFAAISHTVANSVKGGTYKIVTDSLVNLRAINAGPEARHPSNPFPWAVFWMRVGHLVHPLGKGPRR